MDSSSLDGDLSKDEVYGRIYVTRSISGTASENSSSIGDPIGTAQDYEPGQVLVSSGKIGTGYIRLNANPNNQATPYIDIIERTGSGVYDVQLKARLGDLKGVAGTRNVPANFDGFGLMSEVAFLSGSNIKLEAPTFLLGDLNQNFVSGSNSNMEISSSRFHLSPNGDLKVGRTQVSSSFTSYYSQVNTSNLHAHYKFDTPIGTLSDGDTISDDSANSNNLTAYIDNGEGSIGNNNTLLKIGSGYLNLGENRNGNANYRLRAGNTGHASSADTLSVSLWCKPNSVSSSTPQLLFAQANSTTGLVIYIQSSKVYAGAYRRVLETTNKQELIML